MSIYAGDFQMLIRQHFNQILRIRRPVPPKQVARHALSTHLHPESISISPDRAGKAYSAGPFGIQFTVDAVVPCCVKLYWGVSVAACNDFVQRRQQYNQGSCEAPGGPRPPGSRHCGGRDGPSAGEAGAGAGGGGAAAPVVRPPRRWPRPGGVAGQESVTRSLLEMEELREPAAPSIGLGLGEEGLAVFHEGHFAAQSREFFLPAGTAQRYVTPAGDLVDPAQLNFDIGAHWARDGQMYDDTAVVPLVVVIVAQKRPPAELGGNRGRQLVEAHGQMSFVKFRRDEVSNMPRAPEVIRQLAFGDRSAAYEIQGVYGFEDEGESECMICYARPKNVLLLPCRHCSVCHQCLRSLRDEKCPLCRSVFSSYITMPSCRAPTPTQSPLAQVTQQLVTGGTGAQLLLPGAAAPPGLMVDGRDVGAGAKAGMGPAVVPQAQVATQGQHQEALDVEPQPAAAAPPVLPHFEGRQAREVLGRPRGLAPAARTTAQGLRLSGRARFLDRAESVDVPLLQEGAAGSAQPPAARGVAAAAGNEGRDRASPARCEPPATAPLSAEGPADETHILIEDAEVV